MILLLKVKYVNVFALYFWFFSQNTMCQGLEAASEVTFIRLQTGLSALLFSSAVLPQRSQLFRPLSVLRMSQNLHGSRLL